MRQTPLHRTLLLASFALCAPTFGCLEPEFEATGVEVRRGGAADIESTSAAELAEAVELVEARGEMVEFDLPPMPGVQSVADSALSRACNPDDLQMPEFPPKAICSGAPKINAVLQWWLAYASIFNTPIQLNLGPGIYCLDGPIYIPSNVTLNGGGMGQTELLQARDGAASIIFNGSSNAGVSDLTIRMFEGETGDEIELRGPGPQGCILVPNQDYCLWRSARGVVLYGTTDVRVERLWIRGGSEAVEFADNDNFVEPGRGLEGELDQDVDGGLVLRPDRCRPSDEPGNQRAFVSDLVVDGPTGRAFDAKNLTASTIQRSVVRNVGRATYEQDGTIAKIYSQGFGFKPTCGPVVNNLVSENLFTEIHAGDAIDIAWIWPHIDAVANPLGNNELWEDGYFYGNRIVRNIFFDLERAMEMKSAFPDSAKAYREWGCAYMCGAQEDGAFCALQPPGAAVQDETIIEPVDYSVRIGGQFEFSQNLVLDWWNRANLGVGPADDPLNGQGWTGAIAFNHIAPFFTGCSGDGSDQPFDGARIHENVFMRTGTRPNPYLGMSRQVGAIGIRYSNYFSILSNWIGDTSDGPEVRGVPGLRGVHIWNSKLEEPLSGDEIALRNGAVQADVQGTTQGSELERDQLISSSWHDPAGTEFFCEDLDGDGCVNGCEALHGGDPINACAPGKTTSFYRDCKRCGRALGCSRRPWTELSQ